MGFKLGGPTCELYALCRQPAQTQNLKSFGGNFGKIWNYKFQANGLSLINKRDR